MTRFLNAFFVICFYSFNHNLVHAQNQSWTNRLCVEGNLHYGFVMPHHEFISYFITEHVKGYQLNVGLQTDGSKPWHHYFNYPQIGLGVYHSGLGNPEIYGNITALYAFVDRWFFSQKHRFNLGNRVSFGLGYISKKYDKTDDYFNLAIGSKLNVYLNYSVEGLIRIAPLWRMKLGLGFTHTSNGNFREPNKGLNLITSFAALQYSICNPVNFISANTDVTGESDKNQYTLTGAFGRKQISRAYSNMYTVSSISAEYSRKVSRTGWFGLSSNFYYDPSLKKEIELNASDSIKTSTNDLIRITLNLSYELKMGRISYVFQPGVYLKNAYTKPGSISNRIGLRYQLTDRLLASIMIKAHWMAIADYIEWGIGYRWKN